MKKSPILAILLVFGLVLFGCTGPAAPANETAPAVEEPTTPPAEETPSEETPPTETPPAETEPEEPASDLSTETCFELLATGLPVDCTMTTSYQGESQSIRFWMHGESNMRYEMSGQGSDCNTIVMIHKDNADYMGCKDAKWMGTTCDWYMVTVEEEAEGETTAYESGSMDYDSLVASIEDMPTTECSCTPWVPDSSVFETPGKVCDEDEFMEELMGEFGQ